MHTHSYVRMLVCSFTYHISLLGSDQQPDISHMLGCTLNLHKALDIHPARQRFKQLALMKARIDCNYVAAIRNLDCNGASSLEDCQFEVLSAPDPSCTHSQDATLECSKWSVCWFTILHTVATI